MNVNQIDDFYAEIRWSAFRLWLSQDGNFQYKSLLLMQIRGPIHTKRRR